MKWFRRQDPRVRDELRYHRDRLVDDYVAAGMDPTSAERRAFLEFGNVDGLEESVRDVRGRWAADLAGDLRYAWRTLRRSPTFAAVSILSLALGIGANAAIFSVINAVMLRPLPVADPDRLVLVSRLSDTGRPLWVPFPLFERLRDNLHATTSLAALAAGRETVIVDGEDDLVSTDLVSGTYFDLLGVQPAAGRLIAPADDAVTTEAPVAVISDPFWRRRFGRDPAAIGKTVTIRNRPFTIVGVTPASFASLRPDRTPDLTLPIHVMLSDEQRRAIDMNNYVVVGRLKPGATVAQANAEVQSVYAAFLALQASETREKSRAVVLRQRAEAAASPDGFNPFRYEYSRSLLILMGSVGLVLLLACVNLSGLVLARSAARQREFAIRLAIGASRGRIVRQFLAETLVLAALGAVLGLAVAGPLAGRLFSLFLNGREVAVSVAPDWHVAAFAAVIAVIACLVAGLIPAFHAVRGGAGPALKQVRARSTGRLGRTLVVAQLAISMVLLVGATLFIGTLIKLQRVERGFDTRGVLVASFRAAQPYPAARIPAVKDALLQRLAALPGVRSVTAAQVLPVSGSLWDREITVEGYRFRDDESDVAAFNAVGPAYFATMSTPIVAGREFDTRDTRDAPRVAIVNERFARYFFGDGTALGRRVASNNVTYEIVGVAGDAKYQNLRDAVQKTMYIPWTQREGAQPTGFNYILRVADGDPRRLIPDLRRAVREADPALRVSTARPYADFVDESIGTERIMATLGGVFGGLAMLVAGLGMFGLLAYQVARRTNELGVRTALGARRGSLVLLVLRDVAVIVIWGVALGSVGAVMTAGVARALLFGLTPGDPAVLAVAGAVLASCALLAAWLPARRAARVDPLVALRHE
jgi:predicted permease